jgi:hypothetical protein
MKIRHIFIVALFLCSAISAASQIAVKSYAKLKRLNIGDKIPSIPIAKMMDENGNVKNINLTQYNDRLLILDLMNTNCSGCIAGLPRKDSLQKKFGDKIKIIVVTDEDEAYIKSYLKNKQSYPVRKRVQLPWIVDDKLLQQYFPHVTISHFAWIYKGTVVAITDQEYVDEGNIKKILSGEIVNLPVKYEVLDYDYTKQPMFNVQPGILSDESSPVYYSVVSGYQNGFVPFGAPPIIDSVKETIRIYVPNCNSLLTAYRNAYDRIYSYPEKPLLTNTRLVLETKDSSRYIYQPSLGYLDTWSRKNGVCYEGVFPLKRGVKAAYQKMVMDLDAFFGTHARWEMRKVPCWVITQTSDNEEIKKRTEENKQYNYFDTTGRVHAGRNRGYGKEFSLRRLSFEQSFRRTDGKELPLVVDAGYKGTIILQNEDLKNIQSLQAALQQYGFDVKEGEKETEMFVLTDLKK